MAASAPVSRGNMHEQVQPDIFQKGSFHRRSTGSADRGSVGSPLRLRHVDRDQQRRDQADMDNAVPV